LVNTADHAIGDGRPRSGRVMRVIRTGHLRLPARAAGFTTRIINE
jgi:hypothetical protein